MLTAISIITFLSSLREGLCAIIIPFCNVHCITDVVRIAIAMSGTEFLGIITYCVILGGSAATFFYAIYNIIASSVRKK